MWSTTTKLLSFNGNVKVLVGSGSPALPLQGVLVDVYRFWEDSDGTFRFQRLNQIAERTTPAGDFTFTDLQVPVQTQMVIPGTPPYTPIELTNPMSLPGLAFRVSVEAVLLQAGLPSDPLGNQFTDVYDERTAVDRDWLAAHPERAHVPLSGAATVSVLIPEGNPEAMALAGMPALASSVPGREFHFLRVGRAIRQEIGELGDPRPGFANRAGYMTSSNLHTPPSPSFFPGVRDAPFGGALHIGGHFGSDFLTPALAGELYYTVSFWDYTGSLASPFNGTLLTNERRIEDPLFNKKYLLPTPALPSGEWQTLLLGPFEGEITAVEAPHSPTLVGTNVKVYKRPPLPDLATEYWPFWDLIAIWSSNAAPNDVVIMVLEAYQRTGGSPSSPELTKLAMDGSVNGHLPLRIDNRPPVLRLWDWRTGFANFTTNNVSDIDGFGACGGMTVTALQPNGNECLLLRYSVEDGAGGAHPHVATYGLGVGFSPRQVAPAPLETSIPLRTFLGGGTYESFSGSYTPALATAPLYSVMDHESVVVPNALDGWPPENGDLWSPWPTGCSEYALEVGLHCSVRTVDGWGHAFGDPSLSRHIIVKLS